jgi:hypothetical protein
MSNARPRRRVKSSAEQMYFDQLNVDERIAYTIGYAVGQGHPFPRPDMIEALRASITGQTPPALRQPRRAERRGGSRTIRIDLAEVAHVAREAIARGESAAVAVHRELGCSTTKAANVHISRARMAGHPIPYVRNDRQAAS